MITLGVLLIAFTAVQYRKKVHEDKVMKFANQVIVLATETQHQLDSVFYEYRLKSMEAISSSYAWELKLSMVKVAESTAKIVIMQKYHEKRKAIDMNAKAEGVTEDEYIKHVDQVLTGI